MHLETINNSGKYTYISLYKMCIKAKNLSEQEHKRGRSLTYNRNQSINQKPFVRNNSKHF